MVSLIKQPVLQLPGWPKFLPYTSKIPAPGQNQGEFQHSDNLLSKLPLFAELSDIEQQVIFQNMQPKLFEPGETIFAKDTTSNALYLIQEGWVTLFNNPDDKQPIEGTVGENNLLGAADFFLKRPYTQTATVASKTQTLVLDNLTLTSIVTAYPKIGLQLGLAFGRGIAQFQYYLANQLTKVSLLQGLSGMQRSVLARHLSPHRCLPRETIFRSGDPPTGLFFVERGTVWLFNDFDDDFRELVSGDTFGERAVIYGSPHAFTAQASSDVILWLLSPADFAALSGKSPSITATVSHNLFTAITEALAIATEIMDVEITSLRLVAGEHHGLVRKLDRVRHTLNWVKNNKLSV